MANVRIIDLPSASTISGTDQLETTQGNSSRKLTVSQIAGYTAANLGSLTTLSVTGATTLGGTLTVGGITYTFPATQSANLYLKTNGSGVLTWAATPSLALTNLTDIAFAGTAAGQFIRYNGTSWVNSTDGSTLTALNAGQISTGTLALARGGTGAATALDARTNLGLAIGTDVQAYDADLDAIAAITGTGFLKRTGASTWALDTNTYLTGNQSITLSGDITGSGATTITTALADATVTGKLLTGYVVGANSALTATDSILVALQKLQGQVNARLTGNQTVTLSGDASGSGATAITVAIADATVTGKLLTGYAVGTNTSVAATDSILQAVQKLQGQVNARLTGNQTINVTGDVSGSGTTAITLTLPNQAGLTAGTYTKLTVNTKGQVTAATTLAATDIPVLTSAKISDFDTQVRTNRLDQMAVPTSPVSFNGQRLTNVANPVADTDVVNKGYVDLLALGNLDFKASARVATTGDVSLAGGAPSSVDGVTLAANDRVLVRAQANGAQNGIYVVQSVGTGANGTWVRAADADSSGAVTPGIFLFVESGATLADTGWFLSTDAPITLGTTPLVFSQLFSSNQLFAGTGLTKTGNTFSITNTGVTGASYGSASSVATFTVNEQGQLTAAASTPIAIASGAVSGLVASATTDTTNASNISSGTLALARGGTGAGDAATARTNLGVAIGSDVQAYDPDLAAIAALTGTTGFLKKTAADTWSLDTNTYLTGNQSITVTGDVSGSGTTALALTLATVNSNVGTFGGASNVPVVTTNAKGLVTGVTTAQVVAPAGTLSGTTLNSTVVNSSLTSLGPLSSVAVSGTANLNGQVVSSYSGGRWIGHTAPSTYSILHYITMGRSDLGYGTIGEGYRTTTTGSTYTYDRADYAVQLDFANGGLTFKTAPVGVAGTTVPFTDRLTISNTGAVAIPGTLAVTGSLTQNGNAVVTVGGSYADPSWITSLAGSKVSGNISGNAANVTGTVAIANGGTGATNAADARTNLGLAIGTNVQAYDADLAAIAALAGTSGFLKKTAADTWALDTATYLTGNQTISVTGDATGSGSTSLALTLATVNSNVGSFGGASTIPVVTVNAKGLVTAVTTQAVVAPASTLSGTALASNVVSSSLTSVGILSTLSVSGITTLNGVAYTWPAADGASGRVLTTNGSGVLSWSPGGNQTITLSGDVTGSGTTAITATLANSGVTAGTYSNATFTVDAKGRITSASTGSAGASVAVSDDTTTNATRYILFDDTTSGTTTSINVASSKLTFNPSTGVLSASGGFSGNASTATTAAALSNNTDYMVARPTVTVDGAAYTSAAYDAATANGFYLVSNPGSDSRSTLVFNPGGSTAAVQLEFNYGGGYRFRNRTDSTTWTAWKEVLSSASFNSYAPTLTGTGASGTWGISITGNAATATNVAWSGITSKPTTLSGFGITDAVQANATTSAWAYLSASTQGTPILRINQQDTSAGHYLFQGLLGGAEVLRVERTGKFVSSHVIVSNNNANVDGSNFIVDTTNKSTALYAFDVQRSGATVGGITVAGVGVFATGTTVNGNTVLHAGNYTSYSPSLTGSGASGTWGISITGNAATATSATSATSATTATTATNQSGGTVNATTGAFSGILSLTGTSTMNTTTPGTAVYNLRFNGSSTNDQVQALTWSYHNAGDAQAGIYVQSSGAYGTKMYLATTDSFATGAKTAVSIDHGGNVNIARGVLTVSAASTGANNIFSYGGLVSANTDWNTLTNTAGQMNYVQIDGFTAGSNNAPPGVYNYGGIVSFRGPNHSFQLYASHTGNLFYKTQWGNDNYSGWRDILSSATYNSYAPTLTGTGASGTWGISISGTASNASSLSGIAGANYISGGNASGSNSASATQNVYEVAQYKSGFWDTVNAPWTPDTGWWWGATFAHASNSSSYNYSGQIVFQNGGVGDTVYVRNINGGTPSAWKRLLTSGNFTSYAPSLTGSGASGTWGISITGNAATVSSITSGQVTTALGYTPYNSTNPSGYITSSSLSSYLPLSGGTVSGLTNFTASESIYVKGIRGQFTNEYIHLYNKVGIGSPGGWGANEADTPVYGLSTYGGLNIAYGNSAVSTFNGVLRVNGNGIRQGNNLARPLAEWSASGASTGMVYIELPGSNPANYGMVHAVIDVYEYNSTGASTIVVGGHNWSGSWYNTTCNVIGSFNKAVRLAVRDGKFVICLGTSSSSWEYATVLLRKIHNASFYNNVIDMGGQFVVAQTTTESLSGATGDLRQLSTPAGFNAGGAIQQAGNQVLHAGNYTSYSPSLTGSGASGTWAINVSGTAGAAAQISGFGNPTTASTANTIVYRDGNGYIQNNYFYTSGGGSERNASGLAYFAGFNSSDYYIRSYTPQAVASAIGAITTSNYTSYSPSLTGSGASGTWGINITGNSATTSQRSFSNDISTTGQGRFTGWHSGGAATGMAAEIGMSAGQGYIIVYNRDNSTYGTLNLASTSANLQISGGSINASSGALQQGGNQVLHAGNYTSYSPSLTGSGASGTWGINITGRAPAMFYTPTTSGTLDWNDVTNTRPGAGATLLLGTASNGMGNGNYYHPVNFEYSSNDGTGNVTQMAVAYGSPGNELYMRGRYGGTWGGWVRYLNSSNYTSYSPSLTGSGASGTWSINVTGSAGSAGSVAASGITGQTGMWTSAARPGPYRLYRRDDNSDYSVQTNWTGSYWRLYGYSGDTAHAGCLVAYADAATTSNGLNSTNYINRCGSSGNYNTDFNSTPAGSVRHLGDDSTVTNNPGGTWWFVDNYRHSNSSNSWGTQIAWGWEDNANRLAQRNVSGGNWTSWVYYLNSSNYTSYAPSLTGSGASGTWGINITGNAASASTSSQVTINYSNDSNSTYQMLWGSGNSVYGTAGVYLNPSTDYVHAASWNASDWFRSSGATGWYNSTYGGGVYQDDSTWVKIYNSKSFYVANQIAATGDITAYYSDERLKTRVGAIASPVAKVKQLSGFLYVENALAKSLGYQNDKQQVGLSAQEVQAVLPEAVTLAPVDFHTDPETGEISSKSGENYLTVKYDRLVPLLIEAIKEQQEQIDTLKAQVAALLNQ